ncbi:MAG: hypothetical protein LOY00_08005, partial [Methylocaldum sp.]|nr:hypothetical protein [Methylocaldum sp.]
ALVSPGSLSTKSRAARPERSVLPGYLGLSKARTNAMVIRKALSSKLKFRRAWRRDLSGFQQSRPEWFDARGLPDIRRFFFGTETRYRGQ